MTETKGVTADDVVASIEMILGRTPDQALVEYHLKLGFADRFELGRYMLSTDEFRRNHSRQAPAGNHWEEKVHNAAERKRRLLSFGSHARGLLVGAQHGFFVVDPEDSLVSAALLQTGGYEEKEYKKIKSFLSESSDVLVVGSHIGTHVVALSKHCNKVVAIEANPTTFEFLKLNLLLNSCNNVKAYNFAAGDRNERIKLLLNRENSGGSKRMPSLMENCYIYDNPEVIEVESAPLDELLGGVRFDLIIMDIEGSEYFALKGMQRILARSDVLAIEFLPHHFRNVARIEPQQFVEVILAHFNFLYIETCNKLFERREIGDKIVQMFDRGEEHALIWFIKDAQICERIRPPQT